LRLKKQFARERRFSANFHGSTGGAPGGNTGVSTIHERNKMTALLPDIAGLPACPGKVQYNTSLTDFNNVLIKQRAFGYFE
jgi:hypothetical protein